MPRVTNGTEIRRQEILKTAMRLFYEKGYEQTSITDIAKEIHIAQGLCYRYFPSKEALFDAALDQYAQQMADRMTAAFTCPHRTVEECIDLVPAFLKTEAEASYAYRMFQSPEGKKVHDHLAMCVCSKLVPVVQELLDSARDRGQLQMEDTHATAALCVYGPLGILLQRELSEEERAVRVRDFLKKLLQSESSLSSFA